MTRATISLYALAELVLFVLANTTAKRAGDPGTLSQICWIAFVLGLLPLVAVGIGRVRRARRG
jgi:hypothetical protein